MELTDLRELMEEGPDRIEQYFNRRGVPFEKELAVAIDWRSTIKYYISIQCGSVRVSRSRLVSVTKNIKEKAFKDCNRNRHHYFYVNFNRESEETEEYYVIITIFLTDNFWRRMLNEYSLCNLATGLGPKLYPALLEKMEGWLCHVELI